MILMDVNILVYAHREDTPEHPTYRDWVEDTINSGGAYGVSERVLSGFMRVVTHPKVFERPTPLEVALEVVNQIRSQSQAVPIRPGPRHWAIFEKLLHASEAPGNRVPDAYYAALVIAGRHGAGANGYVLSPGKSASISRRRLGRLLVRIPHTTSWSMSAYPWINRLRNAMIR